MWPRRLACNVQETTGTRAGNGPYLSFPARACCVFGPVEQTGQRRGGAAGRGRRLSRPWRAAGEPCGGLRALADQLQKPPLCALCPSRSRIRQALRNETAGYRVEEELMFQNADEVLKYLSDEGVKFVDVRFVDLP